MVKFKSLFVKIFNNHKGLLTTMLISLFILGSCANPSGVGLDVSEDMEIPVLMTDTISVEAYTVLDDSAFSSGSSVYALGLYKTENIGETRADLALALEPSSEFRLINPNAIVDSVVLVLPIGPEYFGDTVGTQFSFEVRQLNEVYNANAPSNKVWDVKDPIIGEKTVSRFAYKLTDSITIRKHVNGKDSTMKVPSQLRIPLSGEFFKTLLPTTLDSASISTSTSFANHVKGLYLSVKGDDLGGNGGIGTILPASSVSGVEIVFRQSKNNTVDDVEIDTIRNFYPINPSNSNTASANGLVSSISHQYKSEITEQLANSGDQYEKTHVVAPAGLRTRIVFPYLQNLKNKNILINKAELIFYADTENGGPYAPRLTLYREDVASRRQNIPDGSSLNSYGYPNDSRSLSYLQFGGWFQRDKSRYSFVITSYLQDVLNGRINGQELFVAPVSIFEQYVPVTPAISNGSQSVLFGPSYPDNDKKMKVVIHYFIASKTN